MRPGSSRDAGNPSGRPLHLPPLPDAATALRPTHPSAGQRSALRRRSASRSTARASSQRVRRGPRGRDGLDERDSLGCERVRRPVRGLGRAHRRRGATRGHGLAGRRRGRGLRESPVAEPDRHRDGPEARAVAVGPAARRTAWRLPARSAQTSSAPARRRGHGRAVGGERHRDKPRRRGTSRPRKRALDADLDAGLLGVAAQRLAPRRVAPGGHATNTCRPAATASRTAAARPRHGRPPRRCPPRPRAPAPRPEAVSAAPSAVVADDGRARGQGRAGHASGRARPAAGVGGARQSTRSVHQIATAGPYLCRLPPGALRPDMLRSATRLVALALVVSSPPRARRPRSPSRRATERARARRRRVERRVLRRAVAGPERRLASRARPGRAPADRRSTSGRSRRSSARRGWNALLTAHRLQRLRGRARSQRLETPNSTFDQKLAFVYRTSGRDACRDAADGRGEHQLRRACAVRDDGAVVTAGSIFADRSTLSRSTPRRRATWTRTTSAFAAGSAQSKTYANGWWRQGAASWCSATSTTSSRRVDLGRGGGVALRQLRRGRGRYVFATRRLNDQNVGTYCGNSSTCSTGSTIDHILLAGADPRVLHRGPRATATSELLTGITQYTGHDVGPPARAGAVLDGSAVAGEAGPDEGASGLSGRSQPVPCRDDAPLPPRRRRGRLGRGRLTCWAGRLRAVSGPVRRRRSPHRAGRHGPRGRCFYRVRLRAGGARSACRPCRPRALMRAAGLYFFLNESVSGTPSKPKALRSWFLR